MQKYRYVFEGQNYSLYLPSTSQYRDASKSKENENIIQCCFLNRLSLHMKSQWQYRGCIAKTGRITSKPGFVERCRPFKKQSSSRSFIFFRSSKEQGNRTGNPKFAYGSFLFLLCIPCPAGQRPSAPAPDGRQVWGRLTTLPSFSRWSHCGRVVPQAFASSPGGRFRSGLPGYRNSRNDFHNLER